MNEVCVRIDGLTKKYPQAGQPAVRNFSLQIPQGSIFGLLGPNGAGKSTLVMMICGLMKPDSGSISVDGSGQTTKESIRRHIGVAPQEIALYPSLTALENLSYFGRMYGLPESVVRERIERYLGIFGLRENAHRRVDTFSGGMKRRLNLIAALLHDPTILILDEPTTGVDVQSRNMMVDFLKGLKSNNITIIYTSHFLDEAERLCTNIAIMDEGELLVEGAPAELISAHEGCKSLEDLFLKLTGRSIRD